MYEGAEEGLGGSEPITREPNLVARKISERRPVWVNQFPSTASAVKGKKSEDEEFCERERKSNNALAIAIHVCAVPECDTTIGSVG